MAILTAYKAFDMLDHDPYLGSLAEASATRIALSWAGHLYEFTGSFTYDTQGNAYGTATGHKEFYFGALVAKATEFSVDANVAQSKLGSATALLSYVFDKNDTLKGSSFDDGLAGYRGRDLMRGKGGDDRLEGGHGQDRLFGGAGDDTLVGGPAADHLQGGPGTDKAVYFSAGYPYSGTGVVADLLAPAKNTGQAEGDTYVSIENIWGTGYADTLRGDKGANELFGSRGDDILRGRGGQDALLGGDNKDMLYGGPGDDRLDGGRGNDRLIGGGGDDRLIGGPGRDFAMYDTSKTHIVIDFGDQTRNAGAAEGERLSGIEVVVGTRFDDTLLGDARDNRFFGGAGKDLLVGDEGADRLHGGDGDDILRGGDYFDRLYGDDGNDRLAGNKGIDRLDGGAGDDVLIGNADGDYLHGRRGADRLFGGAEGDWLFGEAGNDVIEGGAGHDQIQGQAGNDILTGGTGGDTFVFAAGGGDDRVTDFKPGRDHIRIEDRTQSFDDLEIRQQGTDTVIEWSDITILLEDVTAGDLRASDFAFW